LDFFPKDFLTVIDESHVTIPQIRAMYGGDHSRKINLVEYGFRLPAAIDNRPLRFEEFEAIVPQIIFVSATPADYELEKSEGVVVDQLIRPTGLLDPPIEVRPSLNQIDDLMEEIQQRVERDERVLVTTLTKRMAEELTDYLTSFNVSLPIYSFGCGDSGAREDYGRSSEWTFRCAYRGEPVARRARFS